MPDGDGAAKETNSSLLIAPGLPSALFGALRQQQVESSCSISSVQGQMRGCGLWEVFIGGFDGECCRTLPQVVS